MARTHNKHLRAFIDGVDVSGYHRTLGALGWMFGAEPDAAITDECKNILIGQADITAGPYSAFLDTAATMPNMLGGNLAVNGTFAADTNWTKGTNWTITGGAAVATSVTSGLLTAAVAPLTIGKTYLVTFTATVTSGDVAFQDGTANGTARSAAGTYEEIFTAGAVVFRFYSPSGGFTGTLDNVSIQEYVAGGLRSDHGTRNLMVSIGINAAPVMGDHVFAWKFEQSVQTVEQGSGFVALTSTFGGAAFDAPLTYKRPWGRLLLPKTDLTAAGGVNAAAGVDDIAGASSLGGMLVYHLLTSNGTLALKVEDAVTSNLDASFADSTLDTVATTGMINASITPKHGMIALATNRAVRRYIRYQVEWGTATTATATVAFIRNNLAV